ncbi:MAG: tandem-95 repeat protein, partial [Armatimonadota bacterium]
TAQEDTPLTFDLRVVDPEGGPYTAVTFTQPANKKGTIASVDGQYTVACYTPHANANGSDTIEYCISDEEGQSNIATIWVYITPVNDPPVALDGTLTTQEETDATGTLPFTDIDGGVPTFTIIDDGPKGSVLITNASLGSYNYHPWPNETGTDTITFTVFDGTSTSNVGTISVTITGVNDAPTAANLNLSTNEDTPFTGQLVGNDIDGDTLTHSLVTLPQTGTVTLLDPTTGSFQYTPSLNFNGTDTFTYRVKDSTLYSNTATVTLTINPVGDPPVAHDMTVTTPEDTPITFNLDYTDIDGGPYNALMLQQSGGDRIGTYEGIGFTAARFTPFLNANGTAMITYCIYENGISSNPGTITLIVTPVNDVPIPIHKVVTTPEDQAISGILNAADVENDPLTFTLASQGTLGIVELTSPDGHYTYTPNPNATGGDSFTFTASDGTATSGIGKMVVNITPINDAPVAQDGVLTAYEDTVAAGQLDASDADGDGLTYSIVAQGQLGAVEIDPATGSYTYTPLPNVYGTDTFTFKVNDGTVDSNTATITVTITPVSGDAPVALDGILTVMEDQPAVGTLTGYDPDGDPLTYYLAGQGQVGTVEVDPATGGFTYTPNANANGTDAFTFKVSDGALDSNTATVTVTINPVNDEPTARDDALTLDEDATVSINVLANDSDVDGDALTIIDFTQPAHCSSAFYYLGNGVFQYLPEFNYVGTDSFAYTVSDGNGSTATATATITFLPVNDPPTLNYCEVNTQEDTPVNGVLQAEDVDGDALTYRVAAAPDKGTLALEASTGNFTYTPYANATGSDSFQAVASDGQLDSNTLLVNVFISRVNDAPVAYDGALQTAEDTAAAGTLQASDIDGDALTFALAGQGQNGTVVITDPATGAYRYTPNSGVAGDDAFTFTASDGIATSNTATVVISIAPLNDPPVAYDGALTVVQGQAASGTLTGSDPEGSALTFTLTSTGSKGTAAITDLATGTFTYTPNAGAIGADSFTFTVSDGQATSNTATVTVSINAVPLTAVTLSADPPVKAKPKTVITLTAVPTGGTNVEYLFQYGVKKKGRLVWTTIRDFATSPTCTWLPDGTGTFTLQVLAREVGTVDEVSDQLSYAIAKR